MIGKPQWKIELRTGDSEESRFPAWIELRGYGQRYRYVDRDEAERILLKLQATQPHAEYRVVPLI